MLNLDTDQQRLVKSIFQSYNKMLRPIKNMNDVINVTLNPLLYSIVKTDEASESMTMLLWLRMVRIWLVERIGLA